MPAWSVMELKDELYKLMLYEEDEVYGLHHVCNDLFLEGTSSENSLHDWFFSEPWYYP